MVGSGHFNLLLKILNWHHCSLKECLDVDGLTSLDAPGNHRQGKQQDRGAGQPKHRISTVFVNAAIGHAKCHLLRDIAEKGRGTL